MPDQVLPPVRGAFRALAATFVPEASGFDEPQWALLERIVEEQIGLRPEKIRRQLVLLVRVLDALPLLRYGRRFTRLGPEERLALLTTMQNLPILLIRRGVWGLRTLVFMGYYARPEGADLIGYRADPRGWEARR